MKKRSDIAVSGAPGRYKTAQRPGQSGEQDERRPGPSPLSPHPTGPAAPYSRDDAEGSAAIKHHAAGRDRGRGGDGR